MACREGAQPDRPFLRLQCSTMLSEPQRPSPPEVPEELPGNRAIPCQRENGRTLQPGPPRERLLLRRGILNHTLAGAFPLRLLQTTGPPRESNHMPRKKPARESEEKEALRKSRRSKTFMHPAGPHARPELTDPEATPGAGALPDISKDKDVDPGSG